MFLFQVAWEVLTYFNAEYGSAPDQILQNRHVAGEEQEGPAETRGMYQVMYILLWCNLISKPDSSVGGNVDLLNHTLIVPWRSDRWQSGISKRLFSSASAASLA